MSRRPLANSNVVVLPRVVPDPCARCGSTTHIHGCIPYALGERVDADADCNDRPDGPPLDDQPEDHMRAKVEHMRLWRSNREDR